MAQERLTIIVNAMTGQASREIAALDKQIQAAGKSTDGFRGTMNRLGAFAKANAAAIAATVGVIGIAIANSAVRAASALGEAENKSRVVFGEASDQLESWAEKSAQAFGQSKRAALDAAGSFAVFGQSAGLAGPELVRFSTRLTELASDMSSMMNTSPEDAVTALTAALRGESEPIRRYNVLLNEATLRQRALAMGLTKTTGQALTPQQRVLAAYNEVLSQTIWLQNDFRNTQDSLPNQARTLNAELENLSAELGENLIPALIETNKRLDALFEARSSKGIIDDLYAVADLLVQSSEAPASWMPDWVQGFISPLSLAVEKTVDFFRSTAEGEDSWVRVKDAIEDAVPPLDDVNSELQKVSRSTNDVVGGFNKIVQAQKDAKANAKFDFASSFDDAAVSARNLADAVERYNRIGVETAEAQRDAWEEVTRAQDDLREAQSGVAKEAERLAKVQESAAKRVQDAWDRVLDAQRELEEAQRDAVWNAAGADIDIQQLEIRVERARRRLEELSGPQEDGFAADPLDYMEAALDLQEAERAVEEARRRRAEKDPALARAEESLASAMESHSDAQRDAAEATSDAQGSLAEAQDRVRESTEKVTLATAQAQSVTGDYRDRVQEVVDAVKANALAQVDLREKQALAEGQTVTATEKWRWYNEEIAKATAQLNGPAKDALGQYLLSINSVPPEWTTWFMSQVDSGSWNIAWGQLELLAKPRTVDIYVNPRTQAPAVPGGRAYGAAATGGPASGLTLVGERGPELLMLPKGSRVVGASETAGLMRSGSTSPGATNVFNISVDATGATDPRAVGKAVVDALAAWTRSGNRIPSSWVAA